MVPTNNWEYLKVNLTHNGSIKTFVNFACYVDLKDKWLDISKAIPSAYVAASSGIKSLGFKCKRKENNEKSKEIGEGPSKKQNKLNS